MTTGADRLDGISRPNMGRVARAWNPIIPNDSPPRTLSEVGNCGSGCFGLYCGSDGFIRFIDRSAQLHFVAGPSHDVNWLMMGHPVQLNLGGTLHPVQWDPEIEASIRVWAPAGTYIWAECVHVLANETSVPLGFLHALLI